MNSQTATMQVAIIDRLVLVKITGRATFNTSPAFKDLVAGLQQRGYHAFALELSDCPLMDSTFLGVLAGLALKVAESGTGDCLIQLLNATPRILDLLDNLGVSHLFGICSQPAPDFTKFESVPANATAPTKEQVSRTCLEAHELLMAINPDNIPKFKDVTRFLAEDLKKITGADPGSPGETKT